MCTRTPTPTPRLDDQGRQIFSFTVAPGHLLRPILIFETKKGRSRFDAGTCVGPNNGPPCPSHAGAPSDYDRNRPDAEATFDTNLGDGNPTVCDLGPASAGGGGVPGNPDWLTMPGGDPAVTAALQDVSCKFEDQVATGPSDSCTLGRNGLPDFQDPHSTRQYCFVVPDTAGFHLGLTTVAFQARDTRGNLGPRTEIVIEVLPQP